MKSISHDKYLEIVYDNIIANPDWYMDTITVANSAFIQYKKGLDHVKADVLMALMSLTPKQAQKIQKQMNRDMWNKDVQRAIDLRAEGKGLGSFNASDYEKH